jgi:ABC-2 type transport system permease protein
VIDALRFEWVRLRTVRSTYWLIALAIVLPLLLTGLVGYLTRDNPMRSGDAAALLTGGVALLPLLPLPAVMMGILGVLAVGHEYRHATIRPTLTALPARSAIVAAKLVMICVTSAVVAGVGMLLSFALLTVLRGEAPSIDGAGRAALIGYVVLMILWGVVGIGGTLLTRQTALVLPLLFVLPLLVEPILSALTFIPALADLQPLTRFLPFTAGTQLAQPFSIEERGGAVFSADPLSRWQNGAVFAAFAMLLLAPAWLLFEKRDA